MNKTIIPVIVCGIALVSAGSVAAQQSGFTWEGRVEAGIDSTRNAADQSSEVTDTYLSSEAAFEAALTDRLTAFGGLALESVTDADETRAFDNMGLYVSELGLRYAFGDTVVSAGKISPVFAVAWDEAPGFYGTALAEDYELSEMIGVTLDAPVSPLGGTLSVALFYSDDTFLSDSVGSKRGRNSIAAGGVGNTGKLDNVSLQYTQVIGTSTAWIGARHLSAGDGDVSNETGLVAGVSHDFGNGFEGLAEVVHFDGAGGSTQNATYATVGGAYGVNDWTFSAAATLVDLDGGNDHMIALGVDRAISEATEISFGIARFDVDTEQSTSLGLAAVYSF